MHRKLVILVVSLLYIFMASLVSASPAHIVFAIGENSYQVDGRIIPMDASSFMENGRAYVPVRYLAESLSVPEANIAWHPPTQKVSLRRDPVTVELSVGENSISINGINSSIDVSPILKNNRVYLPARFVAEAFGHVVSWNQSTKSVIVKPSATGPAIYGSQAFTAKTYEALGLLATFSPTSWEIVTNNLVAIREFDRSGADVFNKVFDVGPSTASSDKYWYASTIVHDAYHVQQYLEGRPYGGEDAEAEANQKQLQALIDMRAPEYLIQHLKSSMAKKYWEVEYGERNW